MPEISYLCGLGNPGGEYENTRHNLGFDVLDFISNRHRLGWKTSKGRVASAEWSVSGRVVTLIKPLTYMNLSGEVLSFFGGMTPDSLLVICDDINLPLGRLRIRQGGGCGGHRGLESVSSSLGTDSYARLRLGCGPAPAGEVWSDYVLDRFAPEETDEASRMIEAASEAVEIAVRRGLADAQQLFNRRREKE